MYQRRELQTTTRHPHALSTPQTTSPPRHSLGLHETDNDDGSKESKRRVVCVDGRDDGAFYCKYALEATKADFRGLLKHGGVRSTWG